MAEYVVHVLDEWRRNARGNRILKLFEKASRTKALSDDEGLGISVPHLEPGNSDLDHTST